MMFDPFSEEFFDDPYPIYRRLRDEAPVYYSEQHRFYALSRHDDVAAAFRDYESYSSAMGVTLDQVGRREVLETPILQFMDPPEHRRMRALVNRVFTPRAVSALEPMVCETIERYLKALDPVGFDVVADFAAYFPVEVITTMLGVPEADRQTIRHNHDVIMEREPGGAEMTPEGRQAVQDSTALYSGLIRERRENPRDDMISELITAEVDRDDGSTTRLDDIEIVGFCLQLGGAGAETVTKLLGSAMVLFARNHEQWKRLRADRSRVPDAVEEVLRYDGPVQYDCRHSLRETRLHGVTIPADETVMLLPASANRDERAFTDPDVFDVARNRTQAQNLALGYGIHSCLGAALARIESRLAVEMMLDLLPWFEVDEDRLRRVSMTNVNGYASVPVRAVHDGG